MNGSIVKEIFIVILLFMVIMFTIGILFYDCIPQKNEKIDSIEYVADKSVTDTVEEIELNTGSDISSNKESNSLLKSYSIEKEDLTEFASENFYESGKKDPFAEYSAPVEEEIIKTTTVTGNSNNSESSSLLQEVQNTIANTSSSNTTTENQNKITVPTNTTVQNKVEENKVQNTTKEEVKESSTGKYFEKKGSK